MRYVRQKLVQLVVVLLGVTMLSFGLLNLVRGVKPEVAIAGPVDDPARVAQIRHQYHFDEPLPVRYVLWLKDIGSGDFGRSYYFNTAVTDLVKQRLPTTLWLILFAETITLLISVPLGVWAAYRPGGWFDRIASGVAFALLSLPAFIVAVLLVYVLALRNHIFPGTSVYVSPIDSFGKSFKNLFLPAVSLSMGQIAVYMRLLRADMITTLQNDFITMARSKGLSPSRVLWRHAFRPSTFSIITAAAINVGGLLGGTVVVEFLFALPGMGSLVIEAITRRDFLVVQTCVVVFAVGFVLVNFVVDLLYGAIDPRIRHARALL